MLINTVILFLESALPIFIITALLLIRFTGVYNSQQHNSYLAQLQLNSWLYQGGVLSLVMIYILSYNMADITQLLSGMGAEIIFAVLGLLIYLCCAAMFIKELQQSNNDWKEKQYIKQTLALVIIFIVFSLNGTDFNIYLNVLWAQTAQLESLIMGMVLGAGISISIAILLYFILLYFDEKISFNISRYILLLFAVGQLNKATSLLEQVDLLPNGRIVWNSQNILSEDSEFGHFFTALLGYEATPSLMQLSLYVISLLVPIILARVLARKNSHNYQRNNRQNVLLSTTRNEGDL